MKLLLLSTALVLICKLRVCFSGLARKAYSRISSFSSTNELTDIRLLISCHIACALANEKSVDHEEDEWNYHLDKVTTEFNGGSNKDPQIILTYIMNGNRKPLSGGDNEEMAAQVFNHGCGGRMNGI